MTLSLERIKKARQSGYNDEQIIESIARRDADFGSRIKKAREAGHEHSAILQSIEKRLSTPEFPNNAKENRSDIVKKEENVKPGFETSKESLTPVAITTPDLTQTIIPKKEGGLGNAFAQGLKESASGEIARQVFNDKSKEQLLENPSFWEELVHGAGTITGDAPYLLAGTTLGTALGASLGAAGGPIGSTVGGVTGGAFGALAMPAFIKEALKEYRDYVEQGNDITFGEFLSRADRVASKTLKEGAFGVILGSINKAAPLLSKIPGVGKLFESKIPQKAASIAGETVAAATIPPVTEGRLPSKNDFAQAAALVLGMNLLHLPSEIRDRIQKAGEASGKSPEEFAKSSEAKEIIDESSKEANTHSEVQSEKPKSEINKKTETSEEKVEIPEAAKLDKPEHIKIGSEGGKATASFSVERDGAFFPQKIKLTKEEKKLIDASNSWDKSGDRAEASKYAQEAREMIFNRILKTNISNSSKPIIETTSQGANERLEEPQSKIEKIKEKSASALEAVQNPTELAHQIYTKTFDALEPLNRLEKDIPTEERVTTKIKQAQSAASDINNVLTQGIFDNVSNTFTSGSLRDVYKESGEIWKKAIKGLKEQEYSVREMDVYRTSKEALKRQKRGLKSGIDTALAEKDVARLRQKYGPIDQRLREFQKKTLDHYGKNLLGEDVISQWTQDSHASLYRIMDYGKDAIVKEGSLAPKKPWYKAKGSLRKIIPPSESDIQNLSMLISNAKKNDSILQYKKLVEEGNLPGKIVKSKNRSIPDKLIEDLDIDPNHKALAETLYNQSRKEAFTPEKGRLKGWENGKPFEIEVPEDVYETFSSLAPSDTGMFTKIFKSTNNLLSRGIVLEPRKFISIVGRDALSSLIYSKTGSNPISIVKALTDIYKDSHSWNQFKSLGGEQYASRLMTRADRVGKIEELLKVEKPNAILVPFNKLGKFLSDFNNNLSASVPFAEYQRAVKKFGDTPSGRLQALIEAKSVTYDPTKKGSSKLVKDAANFFPFFNVMLQEPAMIAKNMKRPMFWAKGVTAITLPSLLLKMYNEGNPDYDDMNPLLKASCWHFYTEDGHYACPVPWLLGALFKSAPEAFYDLVKGEGGDAWKGLYSYVTSQLSGSFPPILQALVEQTTNRSLPNPAGVALMPFAEVEKRAPPVVPKRLENKPPEEQYTSKTSQLARWYGTMWNASPIKVERLIRTFGGGLASDALAIIDEVAYQTGLAEDLRPEQGGSNYLLLGNFFRNNTPTNTKYTEKFYSELEQARIDEQRGKPNRLKHLNSFNKRISTKFKQYRDVEQKNMDPKKKKTELDKIQKEINQLYKDAVNSR